MRPEVASYESLPHWRRINAALPARVRLAEPLAVKEAWSSIGRFDVHLDRWETPDSHGTIVLVHGAGGNGRMLSVYGQMCVDLGFSAVAPDLPGYGLTQQASKFSITYQDWRDVLAAVVENEAVAGVPVVLFGLSMGGMLAYDVAARTRVPAALIATCLMEPTDPAARRAMVRWPWLAGLIEPVLGGAPMLIDNLPMLMKLSSNMNAITNIPNLTKAIVADPRSGGNWMPGRFLRTFLTAAPEVPPEAFDVCPVLLAHPADDRWTDIAVSMPFMERLTKVETKVVMLDNGGHFPVEAPAHELLQAAIRTFVADAISREVPHSELN